MKLFLTYIFLFVQLVLSAQVSGVNTSFLQDADTVKIDYRYFDSIMSITNIDDIISDCVINDSNCLPDNIVIENQQPSMVSTPCLSDLISIEYMTADEVNPYKYSAGTVPKGAVINILDSNMSEYFTPCYCSVNSPFGYRKWGRYYQFHPGLDLNLPYGQPARAAFSGVVRFARMTPGYGNCVIIRHPNGLETLYGHFSELAVTPGQEVKAGEVVGYCGNTGYSFGAHLHFEIRYMGVPFDPAKVVYTQLDTLKLSTIKIDDALFRGNAAPPPPKYKYVYHVVKKGESLSVIASKYHISVSYLCKLNKITTKTILKPGRSLRIS